MFGQVASNVESSFSIQLKPRLIPFHPRLINVFISILVQAKIIQFLVEVISDIPVAVKSVVFLYGTRHQKYAANNRNQSQHLSAFNNFLISSFAHRNL